MSEEPIAIDPPGCGCTECLTGVYIPLDRASNEQIYLMMTGRLGDHTGGDWTATHKVEFSYHGIVNRTWEI